MWPDTAHCVKMSGYLRYSKATATATQHRGVAGRKIYTVGASRCLTDVGIYTCGPWRNGSPLGVVWLDRPVDCPNPETLAFLFFFFFDVIQCGNGDRPVTAANRSGGCRFGLMFDVCTTFNCSRF
jgi:hypothetical protein